MIATEHETLASAKYARIIVAFCLTSLLAIWILNSNSFEDQRKWKQLNDELVTADIRVQRMEMWKDHSARLYSQLAYDASLPQGVFSHTIIASLGPYAARIDDSPENIDQNKLSNALERFGTFGDKAILCSRKQQPADRTLQDLKSSCAECLTPIGVTLKPGTLKIISEGVDNPTYRQKFLWWIIKGIPVQEGGFGWGTEGGAYISYAKRYFNTWDDSAEEGDLFWKLLRYNQAEGVDFLRTRYEETRNKMRTYDVSDHFSLATLKLPFQLPDLILFLAPCITIFELIFIMTFIQEANFVDNPPFGFPRFGSPMEPAASPFPRNPEQIIARLIWTSFLTMPLLIFFLGILTRYDLFQSSLSLVWHPSVKTSCLENLLVSHTDDPISTIGDMFTLAALVVSEYVLIRSTTCKHVEEQTIMLKPISVLLAVLVSVASGLAFTVASVRGLSPLYHHGAMIDMLIFTLFFAAVLFNILSAMLRKR